MYCILQPGAESKFDAYFNAIFGIWGKKTGTGLTLKEKNPRVGPLCLLKLFGSPFNLAKFHPNWRDGTYRPCLVLWQTQS